MDYFKPPLEEGKWYMELDKKQTELYRGRLWFEVKKEIYETNKDYRWFDKDEFLSSYDDIHYLIRESKPLKHIFTSALKND